MLSAWAARPTGSDDSDKLHRKPLIAGVTRLRPNEKQNFRLQYSEYLRFFGDKE
jgi:hypothetical protein